MARLRPEEYHIPVMADACLAYLQPERGGVFVDATLGGGGHTKLILDKLPDNGRLLSFDADNVAIERFSECGIIDSRLQLIHANFSTMASHLQLQQPLAGALFDLGVSSYQFDHHPRGFSYRHNSPLDMRFSPTGPTAADLLNSLPEHEIAAIIRDYGEDPSAKKLAQAIVRRRTLAPYRTTVDLRDTIVQHIPPNHHSKTLARVFQALRIAVNHELDVLSTALTAVLQHMGVGGRVVVLSYHSLEDRIVKDMFKAHSAQHTPLPHVTILTKKPMQATDEEVAQNPRSRSVRMRVAEVTHAYLRQS